MKEEIIEGWVKMYETSDIMEAEILEARLNDEKIEFMTMNKGDMGYMGFGSNAPIARNAVGMNFKFFVKPEDEERAISITLEDHSEMMDDPNTEFEPNTDPEKP